MYDSDYKIIVLKAAAALYISLLWSIDVFLLFWKAARAVRR